MSKSKTLQEIPENIKPLLEDHQWYEMHRDYNEKVDSGDLPDDIEVIFRKGEDEVRLAKQSKALFYGDRALYDQEIGKIKEDDLRRILSSDAYPRNFQFYNDLKRALRTGFVIPFIGAGLSVDAGCPSWRGYLLDRAAEAGLDKDDSVRRLDNGEFEFLITDIISGLGNGVFETYFKRDFQHTTPEASPGWFLPDMFDGCTITTNFDRVIEDCYANQGKSFSEKVIGLHDTFTFLKAIPQGERYLLKLHGNIDNPRYRVFTHEEYKKAYGEVEVDFNCVLPKLLKRIFSSYSLLFLGCGLGVDRTMHTFEKILEEEGRENIPDHFSIVEAPADDDKFDELNKRLIDCNIHPIWFPNGEYELVKEILNLLTL